MSFYNNVLVHQSALLYCFLQHYHALRAERNRNVIGSTFEIMLEFEHLKTNISM